MLKDVKEVLFGMFLMATGGYLLVNVVKGPSPLLFILIGALAGIGLMIWGVKVLFPMPKLEFDSAAEAAEFMQTSGASKKQAMKALKGHEDIVGAVYDRNAR